MDDRNDDHYVYHDLNLYKHKTVIVKYEKLMEILYRYIITQASGKQHYRNNAKNTESFMNFHLN